VEEERALNGTYGEGFLLQEEGNKDASKNSGGTEWGGGESGGGSSEVSERGLVEFIRDHRFKYRKRRERLSSHVRKGYRRLKGS